MYLQPSYSVALDASGGHHQVGGRGQRTAQLAGGFLCSFCFFHGGFRVGSFVVGGLERRVRVGDLLEVEEGQLVFC